MKNKVESDVIFTVSQSLEFPAPDSDIELTNNTRIPLPHPMTRHCVIRLDDHSLLLTGGLLKSGGFSRDVYLYMMNIWTL